MFSVAIMAQAVRASVPPWGGAMWGAASPKVSEDRYGLKGDCFEIDLTSRIDRQLI